MSESAAVNLSELLGAWAAKASMWGPLVHHDPAERTFALLHRDEQSEVYVVCWMRDHDTGFHDHEECAAAILVLEGAIREERIALGGALGATIAQGGGIEVPSDAIHRVRHAGDAPAVTLHGYSLPLARVGAYQVTEDGALVLGRPHERHHLLARARRSPPAAAAAAARPWRRG